MSYQILFENAIKSYNEGNLDDAEAIARELLQVMPDEPQIKKMLALVAFEKELFEQSSELFYELLSVDPNSPELLFKLAQSLEGLGRFSEAIDYYDKALLITPDDSQIHYGKGVALQSMGQIDSARQEYQTSLDLDGSNWQALLGLATIEPEKGEELLNKAMVLSPNNPFVMYHLALLYKDTGKQSEALSLMKQVCDIYPHPKMLTTLAMLYDIDGNEVKAIEIYDNILNDNPYDSVVANLKAETLVKKGDFSMAKSLLIQVIDYCKNDLDTFANLGAIAHKQGLTLEAIEYYRKAIEINPETPEVLLNLAFILYEQEELDEAIGMFFNVLRLNADIPNLEQGLFDAISDYIKIDAENAHKLVRLWLKGKPDSQKAQELEQKIQQSSHN